MTPKDFFAAAVRVVGLVVLIGGLRYLSSAALITFHSPPMHGLAPPADYLIPGVLGVALGRILFVAPLASFILHFRPRTPASGQHQRSNQAMLRTACCL